MHREHRVRRGCWRLKPCLKACAVAQRSARYGGIRQYAAFFLDTMQPLEWLQWVLIPRMHALLDVGAQLPQNFAIAPTMKWRLRRIRQTQRAADPP